MSPFTDPAVQVLGATEHGLATGIPRTGIGPDDISLGSAVHVRNRTPLDHSFAST
jgi:hypothetical protein